MALLRILINKPMLMQQILGRYKLKIPDEFVDKAKKEIETVQEDVIKKEYAVLFGMLIDNKYIVPVSGSSQLEILHKVDMVWTDNYEDSKEVVIHAAHLHGDGLIYTWEVLDELVKKGELTKDEKSRLLMEIYGIAVKIPERNFSGRDIPNDDFIKSMPCVLSLIVTTGW